DTQQYPSAARLHRPAGRIRRDRDTCNAYVLTAADRALLIDLGSGGVVDHLRGFGIGVDWVLTTHHHRDQCQGLAELDRAVRVAVPERESRHFVDVERFWETLEVEDRYLLANVFSTLPASVDVSRTLEDYARFEWA